MRRDIGALSGQRFDVAVVGGGIHGAWIALRAARAGHSVALLERGDFGSGTSANSLKILHGGLRYLQHLDLRRMRSSIEARREHARLMPHLFQPLPCVMPLEASGLRSPWFLAPALLANDGIAFDRNTGVEAASHLPRGRLLSASRCREEMRCLVQRQPHGGALWWDGIARDTTRLVLETLHEAAAAGALVVNHAGVERILHSGGKVHGVAFIDAVTGRSHELQASRVVNACGPWSGALAHDSGLPINGLPAAWTGALNVVLRRSLGHQCAVALSAPQAGRDPDALWSRGTRELFFVPWQGRTMIGTAYFPVESVEAGMHGPPDGAVAGFMALAAALAPAAMIAQDDLALVHWGLMPLERSGDAMPRKTPLIVADPALTGAAGLVHVIGEKLTSAPHVSARVLSYLPDAGVPSRAQFPDRKPQGASGVPEPVRDRLIARYGHRWAEVAAPQGTRGHASFAPLHAGSPVLQVELQHAVQSEMALGVHDALRRIGLHESGDPGADALQACLAWGVQFAGWNREAAVREALALEGWFRANRSTR